MELRLVTDAAGRLLMAYRGGLPRGCELCKRGAKLVVFVTGECLDRCWYCPVNPARMGRRLLYADEEPASSIADILREADAIGAEGASFTGGDPLLALDRVKLIASELKSAFGSRFHIHLYTTGRLLTVEAVDALSEVVDEVRVHPQSRAQWEKLRRVLEAGPPFDVGVEYPVVPGAGLRLAARLAEAWRWGLRFANLNELEWAPHTLEEARRRGLEAGEGPAVRGSLEEALAIMALLDEAGVPLPVHLCTARFKDAVQTRARLARKASRLAGLGEEPTPEGTIRGPAGERAPRLKGRSIILEA